MLILVRLDLTEKGIENYEEVVESLDYNFQHEEILNTEIVDIYEGGKLNETKRMGRYV